MSLLETKSEKKLSGEYAAKVKEMREVENDNGGYVEVKLILKNETEVRDFTWCIFPSNIQYVTDALNTQHYGTDAEDHTLGELLGYSRENAFLVWMNWNLEYSRYNVGLYPPRENTKEEIPEM